MKAIAAEPIEPAIFKKSVKFGMIKDIPVMIQMMIDLTPTLLHLITNFVPVLKNE